MLVVQITPVVVAVAGMDETGIAIHLNHEIIPRLHLIQVEVNSNNSSNNKRSKPLLLKRLMTKLR